MGYETTSFIGKLQGWVAIGGETPGWALVLEKGAGIIEVETSGCSQEAAALRDQRVTITGRFINKEYVERRSVPILVAERISPA